MRHAPQNSFSKLVLLNERTSTVLGSEKFRYGFQNQEHDDELKGDGNSYTTEFRLSDPRLGKWLSLDPKAGKYPMDSPYMAYGNNPISIIDGDGREKIVVVGSDDAKWNLRFVLTGIKSAREMKKKSGDEDVSILLFKEGYSDRQIQKIQKYVNKQGINIQVVTSADDVVAYINNKSITSKNSGRKDDLITDINIFAHGKPGEIMFGYHQKPEIAEKYRFDSKHVKKMNSSAFNKGSEITSYACRTGAGKEVGDFTLDTKPENSLAQEIADQTGARVSAFQCRSEYVFILPGESIGQAVAAVMGWIPEDKTFDKENGNWDTNSAIDKVDFPCMGNTPMMSPGMTTFEKGKKPERQAPMGESLSK